ncbi:MULTISPECIES: hypothetical protein [Paenibacillus]|nr:MULTISPECIES: hypothetical protein [Paenibacillus]MEC0246495.1 hypothetical protein [Paenibacillus chitinolyticus]GKS11119.1 hypothetical protein YDYSY3_21190 [Paenibacillus chitinolyticus]
MAKSNNSKEQDIHEKENKQRKSTPSESGGVDKKLSGPNFPAT